MGSRPIGGIAGTSLRKLRSHLDPEPNSSKPLIRGGTRHRLSESESQDSLSKSIEGSRASSQRDNMDNKNITLAANAVL